jgi:hypothetical protein
MEEQMRSADQMLKMVMENPARLDLLKINPLPELQKLRDEAVKEAPVYFRDKLLYRIAVLVLGALAIIAAVGSVVLVREGETTPEVLVALGSAAVGALVGLFAPSPTGK